jgi:hypothetical protein
MGDMASTVRLAAIAAGLGAACWAIGQPDYPGANWIPAYSGNFTVSNRPSTYPINYLVIHVMQGSYGSAINWFQNPNSNVSAHYLLRSVDGDVTQMVREKDVAWHAGNWNYNTWSVGIEHEGFVDNPAWFTPTMYESSARLSRYLTLKYGIPRTRQRVIGHVEVPGATHTDPGPHWNWTLYMEMMRLGATFSVTNIPAVLQPGQVTKVLVGYINTGDDPWLSTGPNPIRLSTVNPVDHASAFYNPGQWISPTRPAAVYGQTIPGMRAAFIFTLRAPSTPGIYSESFQLVKEGISRFGPILDFTIAVGTGEAVRDNDSSFFEAVGNWSTGNSAPGRYGPDYRYAATPSSAYASWYLDAPVDGYYDVYAWWSQGTNRSNAATYQVRTAQNTFDYVVNQQANGGQWNYLGRHWLPKDDGFVRLLATGPYGKVAIADAVKFAGPYPNP